jgi:hypothetical protein
LNRLTGSPIERGVSPGLRPEGPGGGQLGRHARGSIGHRAPSILRPRALVAGAGRHRVRGTRAGAASRRRRRRGRCRSASRGTCGCRRRDRRWGAVPSLAGAARDSPGKPRSRPSRRWIEDSPRSRAPVRSGTNRPPSPRDSPGRRTRHQLQSSRSASESPSEKARELRSMTIFDEDRGSA